MPAGVAPTPEPESSSLEQAERLMALLAGLAEHEERFGDALYARFFERCPEAVPLFGVHSISEREEMVRETFRCLLADAEDADWLEGNLQALGRSHVEYGVEDRMYPPFVDAFVDGAQEILGQAGDALDLAALRDALERIVRVMREV